MFYEELKTFGSLDSWLSLINENGSKLQNAKDFKNVIRERLILKNEKHSTSIIDKIPPPPLHLFMGVVNLLCEILINLWPDFLNWASSKYILRHGYHGHGGGFEGANCSKLIKNLDELENEVLHCCSIALPVVSGLKAFRVVVTDYFSHELNQNIKY